MVSAPVTEDLVIRLRTVGTLGLVFPPTAQLILNWALAAAHRKQVLSFAVPSLPPSVNHIYETGRHGKRILTPECHAFRLQVKQAIHGFNWRPTGQLIGINFYQSPHWITKRRTIRPMDADNRAKALYDAIEGATGVNDSRLWEYHSYKIPSPRVQTSVYVIDLGDIIDWYK